MGNTMKHLRYLLMAALVALPLAACDEDDDTTTPPAPVTGTVAGTVSVAGTGQANVDVTLVGATSQSVKTGSDGKYTFASVEAGSYGVTISNIPAGTTFATTSKTTAITTQGQTVTVDFTGSYITTSSIIGTVTADGIGLNGVAVALAGTQTGNSVTANGGNFSFTGLRAGTYTVTISNIPAGHAFATTSYNVTVGVGEAKAVAFVGNKVLGTISGVVTVDNLGLAGVAVALTGAAAKNTVTGAAGAYSFGDLQPGTYTVTITNPDATKYSFTTSTFGVTLGVAEAKTVVFAGTVLQTATISGAVTVDNVGMAGVTVALSGAASATTQTGVGGAYTFANLQPGTYTVTITNPDPVKYIFDVVAQNATVARGETKTLSFPGRTPLEHAKISINAITRRSFGGSVPVNLSSVYGQIEVATNVSRGDFELDKVDVVIISNSQQDTVVVATQKFATGTPSPAEALAPAEVVTLNVPTDQVRMGDNTYIPAVFNGGAFITALLWETGVVEPVSTNKVAVVMDNSDVLMASDGAMTPGVVTRYNQGFASDIVTGVGLSWNTGGLQYTGPIYISFSTTHQASYWSAGSCGSAGGYSQVGAYDTGIIITNLWACAGVEAQNQTPGTSFPTTFSGPTLGPDGTAVSLPSQWSALGAKFELDDEDRWYVLTPGPAGLSGPAYFDIDNRGPSITVQNGVGPGNAKVAFNDNFDEPWVNASYAFAVDGSWTDGGVGVDAATKLIHLWVQGSSPYCNTAATIVTGADLNETIASDGTPDGYQICASGADLLGNVGANSGPSNWFGVDKVAPQWRFHGTTAATPALVGTLPTVSVNANTTIYGCGGVCPGPAPYATDVWGLEALDTRAGFNQNAVTGYPAYQLITRQTKTVNTSIQGPSAMNVGLSDTYVRTASEWAFHAGFALPGYYSYTGRVTDRAGNATPAYVRNWLTDDQAAPTITFATFAATFYAPGQPADFVIFGADDLEVITAAFTVDYPTIYGQLGLQYDFAVGQRWDGLNPYSSAAFNNAVTGVNVQVPSLLGRLDFTCSGAGAPYASCAVADALPVTLTEYNHVDGTNLSQMPVSVTPIHFEDAGMNLSAAAAPILFNPLQFSASTAAPWSPVAAPDIDFWRIIGGTQLSAQHTASTSIEDPFFTSVLLVLNDAGTLLVCGAFPAPVLTDNGINRFWTSTLAYPATGTQCNLAKTANPAATYHAVGVYGNALLASQGIL
jgi:hypothetical protein